MKNVRGRLFLIPTDLGGENTGDIWPSAQLQRIAHIRHFIVENQRSARRFLRKAGYQVPFNEVVMYDMGKHSDTHSFASVLEVTRQGFDMGLMSEAGLPCVADPGQFVVSLAHEQGIQVIPLAGPGSVYLALMASGFNGQHFIFHGYLPIAQSSRHKMIAKMEQDAHLNDRTQIFMETPFRNMQLFHDLLQVCKPDTWLCVAVDLTTSSEYIKSLPVSAWKKEMPDLHRRPGIFLLYRRDVRNATRAGFYT